MKKTSLKDKVVETCSNCCCHKSHKTSSPDSPVYGLGLIGAAFYFLPGSTGLDEWLWHIFQTITWPGFVVYEVLKYFGF